MPTADAAPLHALQQLIGCARTTLRPGIVQVGGQNINRANFPRHQMQAVVLAANGGELGDLAQGRLASMSLVDTSLNFS